MRDFELVYILNINIGLYAAQGFTVQVERLTLSHPDIKNTSINYIIWIPLDEN